jgi:hypothetical protein
LNPKNERTKAFLQGGPGGVGNQLPCGRATRKAHRLIASIQRNVLTAYLTIQEATAMAKPATIMITGATGNIGKKLRQHLAAIGRLLTQPSIGPSNPQRRTRRRRFFWRLPPTVESHSKSTDRCHAECARSGCNQVDYSTQEYPVVSYKLECLVALRDRNSAERRIPSALFDLLSIA